MSMRERSSIGGSLERNDRIDGARFRNNMASPRQRTQSKTPDPDVRLVLRRCRVCEWQEQVVEAPGADPDCPWCHGPTQATPIADELTTHDAVEGKNPHAAALGRLGGLKGGRARAATLTAKQRRDIASKAARARWHKR
jgi:hypothetical protein